MPTGGVEDAAEIQNTGVVEQDLHVVCFSSDLLEAARVRDVQPNRDDAVLVERGQMSEVSVLAAGGVNLRRATLQQSGDECRCEASVGADNEWQLRRATSSVTLLSEMGQSVPNGTNRTKKI